MRDGVCTPGPGDPVFPRTGQGLKPHSRPWCGARRPRQLWGWGPRRLSVLTGGPGRPLPCNTKQGVRTCWGQRGRPPPTPSPELVTWAVGDERLGGGRSPDSAQDPSRDCREGWAQSLGAPHSRGMRTGTHPQPRWSRGSQASLQEEVRRQGWAGARRPHLCLQTCPPPSRVHLFCGGAPILLKAGVGGNR